MPTQSRGHGTRHPGQFAGIRPAFGLTPDAYSPSGRHRGDMDRRLEPYIRSVPPSLSGDGVAVRWAVLRVITEEPDGQLGLPRRRREVGRYEQRQLCDAARLRIASPQARVLAALESVRQ